MVQRRNRNRQDIWADILNIARVNDGAKKSWLVHQGNLNFETIKVYLKELIDEKGFLRSTDNLYFITEKGLSYLEKYKAFMEGMVQ